MVDSGSKLDELKIDDEMLVRNLTKLAKRGDAPIIISADGTETRLITKPMFLGYAIKVLMNRTFDSLDKPVPMYNSFSPSEIILINDLKRLADLNITFPIRVVTKKKPKHPKRGRQTTLDEWIEGFADKKYRATSFMAFRVKQMETLGRNEDGVLVGETEDERARIDAGELPDNMNKIISARWAALCDEDKDQYYEAACRANEKRPVEEETKKEDDSEVE